MPVFAPVLGALGGALAGGLLMLRSARHCRKPADSAGRTVLQRMNASHAGVTAWGLSHVDIGASFTILDVGCGGGRTIERLLSVATKGKVFGVDYSETSVAVARETNQPSIAEERCNIQQATVSQLPYPDDTFDLVTAVETHYYWPDLRGDLREVMRVLKRGGQLAIIAEAYRGRRNNWQFWLVMRLVLRASYLTPAEHRDALIDAGYAEIRVFEEKSKGWISAIGVKP